MRILRFLFVLLIVVSVPLTSMQAQATPIILQLTIPTSLGDVYSASYLTRFEDSHPGIKIQVNKQIPMITSPVGGLDQHFEAVQKYVSSGDVLYVTAGTISDEATQAGYFLDLAPLVAADTTLNPDDFYPAIWQSYQWNRGIWALPVSGDPFVLLYNPDVFDKEDLAYPNEQWTIDDLIDAARKLTVTEADGTVKPGLDVITYGQGYALRAISGVSVLDTSVVPNTPKFATPEMIDLIQKWAQLDNDGAMGVEMAKAPLSIAPAIWLAVQEQLLPGEKRAATMLPGGQAAISVDGFAVSGGTQYPQQAYELAAWLTQQTESSNSGLASTPARMSLKGTAGSDQLAFKLDIPPEVQALIDQSIANAIPLSEMRFADYMATAYYKIKNNKADPMVALQEAETTAMSAQQQAMARKDSIRTTLYVATPVASSAVVAGKVEIKFAINNAAPMISNQEQWNKFIADFTVNDPTISKVALTVSTDAIDKLTASYDCFYLPYNGVTPDKLAKLLPLDPLTSADNNFDATDIFNGVMAQVTFDHKLYALPVDIAPDVLKYDDEVFQKAGIPAPGLVWTTEQFVDALKQLKTYNGDKPGFSPTNSFGSYLMNLITAYGGLPIDYRTTPPTISFTDPATLEAIQQVADLATNGYLKYRPLFSSQMDLVFTPEPSFIKPATLSAYSLSSLLSSGVKDNLKLTLYPRGSTYSAVSYTVGALYISATSSVPDACYRWMSAITKDATLFTGMPARRSLIDDPLLETAQGKDVVAIYKQLADLLNDPDTISIPGFSSGIALTDLIAQLELYKALDSYLGKDSTGDLQAVLTDSEMSAKAFLDCAETIPSLDMTSTDSQKTYFKAAKACALKADEALAPFFAGVKTD